MFIGSYPSFPLHVLGTYFGLGLCINIASCGYRFILSSFGGSLRLTHNVIRNIALSIGKYISDNYYGEISTIDKNAEIDVILLNGQVMVILFSLIVI